MAVEFLRTVSIDFITDSEVEDKFKVIGQVTVSDCNDMIVSEFMIYADTITSFYTQLAFYQDVEDSESIKWH